MAMMTNINILEEIATIKAGINRKGYVLVCSSGTEPQVHVMVIAEIEELCDGYISRLLDVF
ncbi:hypothetical protein [Turicibacter bilis]|uniref:hypothetical protein n=1 Tax=Turicibacter bilis TaxID=2735723 RepID=UPI0031BB2FC7